MSTRRVHDLAARPVLITGVGVTCAVGRDLDSFSLALREGRSGIRADCDFEPGAMRVAARVRDFELCTELRTLRGIPDAVLERGRRAGRRAPFPVSVAIATALRAWQDAGLSDAGVPGDRVSLIVAGNNLTGRYVEKERWRYLKNPAYLPASFPLRVLDTDHVGTLSEVLGVVGEGYTVGGASASGNVGIINGIRLINLGAADVCLVVGALADLSPLELQGFYNIGAMAVRTNADPGAACRPFDQENHGFVYGQGCGCLVLESERSVEARGVSAMASLVGYALKLDGSRMAAPTEEGEAHVMALALRRAGLGPDAVSYVNAHGTGSPLGDAIEVRAVRRALGAACSQPWVNSTKGWIGHCLSSAAVVEAIATVAQMRDEFVHPNANLEQPIDSDIRFVGAKPEPARIRVALSNSFGFGGISSTIVIENPQVAERSMRPSSPRTSLP